MICCPECGQQFRNHENEVMIECETTVVSGAFHVQNLECLTCGCQWVEEGICERND